MTYNIIWADAKRVFGQTLNSYLFLSFYFRNVGIISDLQEKQ